MATNLKRFTISVTPDMVEKLADAKREIYYNATQNEMIRDLIETGLNSLQTESKKRQGQHDKTA